MSRAHAAEDWDLTPEAHADRARELLKNLPKAGEAISADLERVAIAQRHSACAMLKMADECQEVLREIRHLRNRIY